MAKFYKGFTYEVKVTAPLTIEGNKIELKGLSPKSTPESISQLAREYIRHFDVRKHREKVRRCHRRKLCCGKDGWNQWRRENPQIMPMLAGVHLSGSFNGYDFSYANFTQANLAGVHMQDANFHQAILAKANLTDAHLERANFCRADLYETKLQGARLTGANLQGVQLARTNLQCAKLRGSTVYGATCWDPMGEPADQRDLIIKYRPDPWNDTEEKLRVDGLDLAAFLYYTLNNRNISRLIEGVAEKWVLLLGRFPKKGGVLRALRKPIKDRGYIPLIFDFPRAAQSDLIEQVMLLAGMSKFIIVDITSPKSAPMELQAIAPNFGVPIIPIIQRGKKPFATFSGLSKFRWVHHPIRYGSARAPKIGALLSRLDEIVEPAEAEAGRLTRAKAKAWPIVRRRGVTAR